MAAERRVVRHDHAIADPAIMGHVDPGHEEAMIAHPGLAAAFDGTGIHGGMRADDRVAADRQRRRLALVAEMLGRLSQRREGMDAATGADACPPGDRHVAGDRHAVAELHLRPDGGIGADGYPRAEPRARLDDRRRMDVSHHTSRIIAANVASATT